MDKLINWLSGGNHQYMQGWHCINHDYLWGWINIILCITIVIGYIIIAFHWYSNLKTLKKGLAKSSLFDMVNIFLFCGICGYVFLPLKMWWPAWRLHALFLVVLNYFTWRYALNTPKLRVVYEEVHNAGALSEKLQITESNYRELVRKIYTKLADPINNLESTTFFGTQNCDDPNIFKKLASIRMSIVDAQSGLKEIMALEQDAKHVQNNNNRS